MSELQELYSMIDYKFDANIIIKIKRRIRM